MSLLTTLLAETSSSIDDLPITWGLVGAMASVAAGTAWLTRYVGNQFTKQTRTFYRIVSKHNREDDDRFEILSGELWGIREHIARRDGESLPPRKTFSRRNYLVEDGGNDDDNKD